MNRGANNFTTVQALFSKNENVKIPIKKKVQQDILNRNGKPIWKFDVKHFNIPCTTIKPKLKLTIS